MSNSRRASRLLLVCAWTFAGALPIGAQSTLHTFIGENPSGFPGFGHSVSGGEDVDGDGFPDLLVGAPYENSFLGQAKVFSGRNGSVIHTLTNATGGHYGVSVDMAGDVNQDGYCDVIVGAEQFTIFNELPGYAEVRSGADGSVLYHWDGDGGRDQFGDDVASAGDVNGDGIPDLIVGAPYNDDAGSDAGMARVFSGLDGSILYTKLGPTSSDNLGFAVDGAGDLNGDGYHEFIVGVPNGGPGAARGQVIVYSGMTGLPIHTFNGAENLFAAGYSVSGAGDVNNDGTPDIVFGATGAFTTGAVEVHSGLDGSLLHQFVGSEPSAQFGRAVGAAGDVNGDGFADILVSAHLMGPGGRAWIYSGRDGSTIHTFDGELNDRFGESLHAAGDIDGDGFDDVIVGADQFSSNPGPGEAIVFNGKPAFRGSVNSISLAAGGTLDLGLSAGSASGGYIHWILGSVTGFAPGIDFGGDVLLPLNVDPYFTFTLTKPFSGIFSSYIGLLNGMGEGAAALTIPPGTDPSLAGISIWHAYLASAALGDTDYASNSVLITFVP